MKTEHIMLTIHSSITTILTAKRVVKRREAGAAAAGERQRQRERERERKREREKGITVTQKAHRENAKANAHASRKKPPYPKTTSPLKSFLSCKIKTTPPTLF
eukprot:TRINITY_DN23910_c0_g1_i2.p1 TRINITY_DN23910_c0_g1~~TRINITY_DN23910_c0_g1_i2.p1  ORF type:complete len:103 (+),score=21.42 TRINITY_DN23910_c0_g1_i2:181-489(+)